MSRLFHQDQDQDFFFKTKTKTIFHVLDAPRDQDQGLETTSLDSLVFWTSTVIEKQVIKYHLYVKFARIFAHNVQTCDKFCCKNFNDVCHVFRILHHYTWGREFVHMDTLYNYYIIGSKCIISIGLYIKQTFICGLQSIKNVLPICKLSLFYMFSR